MRTVAVALEGVLQDQTNQPVWTTVLLMSALGESYRVVIMSNQDKPVVERWFRQHGLTFYDDMICNDNLVTTRDLRMRQIDTIQAGFGLEFVVESNPEIAAQMVREGLTVLLFANPKYVRPEHRPDAKGPVPWSSLVHELDLQQGLADKDKRLDIEDAEVQRFVD